VLRSGLHDLLSADLLIHVGALHVRRQQVWLGDLVEASELLLEALQLAANSHDLAAAAAALVGRTDGAGVLAVRGVVDELMLAVFEAVGGGTESLLYLGGRSAWRENVGASHSRGHDEQGSQEQLGGHSVPRSTARGRDVVTADYIYTGEVVVKIPTSNNDCGNIIS